MSTHAEFRRAAWRHWGNLLARIVGAFGLGTFVFFALSFLLDRIEPGEPAAIRAEIAMAVAVAVGLTTAVVSARSAVREPGEDPLLSCPRCGGSIGYYDVVLALTSENCPHCGERMLED